MTHVVSLTSASKIIEPIGGMFDVSLKKRPRVTQCKNYLSASGAKKPPRLLLLEPVFYEVPLGEVSQNHFSRTSRVTLVLRHLGVCENWR